MASNAVVASEERFKEPFLVEQVDHATRLPDRVHGQHRCTNVDSLYSSLCGHHGPDSRPARLIVSHNELLKRHASFFGEHFENRGTDGVSHISLVGVDLQDYALVDSWLVIRMKLLRVIRVHPMGHVSREEERTMNCLKVGLLIEMSISRRLQSTEDTLGDLCGHVTAGSLSGC